MFDVTVCQFDTPIVLSWPHFLNAEEKYSKGVTGLKPDPEKHGFWFDIQDVTGTTLSAKARIQINMNVKKLKNFSHLSKINDTVIPILWFEEGIDELGKLDLFLESRQNSDNLCRPTFKLSSQWKCFIAIFHKLPLSGTELINVLKQAATDPLEYRQYILYALIGNALLAGLFQYFTLLSQDF